MLIPSLSPWDAFGQVGTITCYVVGARPSVLLSYPGIFRMLEHLVCRGNLYARRNFYINLDIPSITLQPLLNGSEDLEMLASFVFGQLNQL
jgi:hypothetical protein